MAILLALGWGPSAAQDGMMPLYETYIRCIGGEAVEAAHQQRIAELDGVYDLENRLRALCEAGDRAGAEALMDAFDAELYAGEEGARIQTCDKALEAGMRAFSDAGGVTVIDVDLCDFGQ
jgi:hypothetical protein